MKGDQHIWIAHKEVMGGGGVVLYESQMFLFKRIPQWMSNNSDFEQKECESAVVNKVKLTQLRVISLNYHTLNVKHLSRWEIDD